MAAGKIVAFALLAVAVPEVTSWTIDLPYARKLFFSANKEENAIQVDNSTKSYNNIEPNSFHNADDYYYDKYVDDNKNKDVDNLRYAEEYKHEGYMEKKVHDIVRRGSAYLDGLKRSLERYAEILKNCSRMNFNETQSSTVFNARNPPFPPPSFNYTQLSDFQNSNFSLSDVPIFNVTSANISQLNPNFRNQDSMAMCAAATKRREHVRRLTDLALWATKRLQDNAYDAKYNKYYEQEENELLLKLAWFLDRLAHYTGFEPNVEEFINLATTARPTTSSILPLTTPPAIGDVPPDVVRAMIDCMRLNSSEPAAERCRYPLPLPDELRRRYELRDRLFGNNRPQDPSFRAISPTNFDSMPSSSLELLIAADSTAANNFPPKPTSTLTDVKSVQKRSIDENPLLKIMKYYGKHKVWVNSNPLDANNDNKKGETFDVPNQLAVKSIKKRSLFKKHLHLRLPEPLHALKDHVKKEAAIHFVNNKEHIKLIKGTLEKMRHTASLTVKHNLKKFDNVIKNIHKRSVHYGRKYLPRVSEDPYQDISYYSKNVKGIEYNYDPAQAALVRLGLEQIFQTGNIEVVRRYGSNYNPAIPNPFYAAVLRSSIDV